MRPIVRITLRISCEAVPPSVLPAGAQGGTSACSTGAALSFVSCICLLGDVATPSTSRPSATGSKTYADSRLQGNREAGIKRCRIGRWCAVVKPKREPKERRLIL